jgi:hypothetical protein
MFRSVHSCIHTPRNVSPPRAIPTLGSNNAYFASFTLPGRYHEVSALIDNIPSVTGVPWGRFHRPPLRRRPGHAEGFRPATKTCRQRLDARQQLLLLHLDNSPAPSNKNIHSPPQNLTSPRYTQTPFTELHQRNTLHGPPQSPTFAR